MGERMRYIEKKGGKWMVTSSGGTSLADEWRDVNASDFASIIPRGVGTAIYRGV